MVEIRMCIYLSILSDPNVTIYTASKSYDVISDFPLCKFVT